MFRVAMYVTCDAYNGRPTNEVLKFVISLGLYSSITSVFVFGSILISRNVEVVKLEIGLGTLYISLTMMFVTFTTRYYTVMRGLESC